MRRDASRVTVISNANASRVPETNHDALVMIPGHAPAWHDKNFLNLEADLFESIVNQVVKAERQGLVTADEIQNAVDVEPFRLRFTNDDKALNAKSRRYVNRMIENLSAEKRDSRKFSY